MILNSLGIETEVVDITAPAMDEARDFMRAHGKKKEGQRFVLPPQIFNGEKYCGVSYMFLKIQYSNTVVYHDVLA